MDQMKEKRLSVTNLVERKKKAEWREKMKGQRETKEKKSVLFLPSKFHATFDGKK